MKKNKAVAHVKRRQKASMKAKERARKRGPTPPSMVPKSRGLQVTDEQFPDEDQVFWLAHGVNYLVSDYENGTWNPIFEGLYTGQVISPEEIATRLMERFGEDTWPPEGKSALAWTVQSKSTIFVYYQEALRRLRADDASCDAEALSRQPHNGIVWGVFNYLKQELVKRQAETEGAFT